MHAFVPVRFGAEEELDRFLDAHAIEPPSILKAAWAILLRSYTGSDRTYFAFFDQQRNLETICDPILTEDQTILQLLQQVDDWDLIGSAFATERRLNSALLWNCCSTDRADKVCAGPRGDGSAAWLLSGGGKGGRRGGRETRVNKTATEWKDADDRGPLLRSLASLPRFTVTPMVGVLLWATGDPC